MLDVDGLCVEDTLAVELIVWEPDTDVLGLPDADAEDVFDPDGLCVADTLTVLVGVRVAELE